MISWEELVLRLVVAAILGGLVGLERERAAKSLRFRRKPDPLKPDG